jgi:hypothetical protein
MAIEWVGAKHEAASTARGTPRLKCSTPHQMHRKRIEIQGDSDDKAVVVVGADKK